MLLTFLCCSDAVIVVLVVYHHKISLQWAHFPMGVVKTANLICWIMLAVDLTKNGIRSRPDLDVWEAFSWRFDRSQQGNTLICEELQEDFAWPIWIHPNNSALCNITYVTSEFTSNDGFECQQPDSSWTWLLGCRRRGQLLLGALPYLWANIQVKSVSILYFMALNFCASAKSIKGWQCPRYCSRSVVVLSFCQPPLVGDVCSCSS